MGLLIRKGLLAILVWMHLITVQSQRDFDQVTIRSEQLTDAVHVLYGAGGNICLAIGEEWAYLIDDQFGPLTDKILEHVTSITDKPIRFVLNTHWHGDHTGGNENMAEKGAVIIAHDNVYKRMSTTQDRGGGRFSEPASAAALPVIMFNDRITLALGNGKSLHGFHVAPSHTDGDAYYYFPEENVIHIGDNFFEGKYPYIDLNSGGDIDGLISNITMVLGMVDEDTRIIPGHGSVSDRNELQGYLDVLVQLRTKVVQARNEGKSLEAVQAMGISKTWDATHGGGFIGPERIIEFIYKSAD